MMALKRLIRPILPDRLVAWFKLRQQSRHSRHNVLMFVSDKRARRRWAAVTPDTYRLTLLPTGGAPAPDYQEIPAPFGNASVPPARMVLALDPATTANSAIHHQAVGALMDYALDAVVVGYTPPPRLWVRSRQAPHVTPVALAMWGAVWNEANEGSLETVDLSGLLPRIENAGRRTGLIPIGDPPAPNTSASLISIPVVVMISAVPLHDVGGGSRAAQLALELLRRGHHVVFVNVYDSAESVDLGLRYVHPHLEQVRLADFDAAQLRGRADSPGIAIVELPIEQSVQPLRLLRQAGFTIVYDLIDDWSAASLGGDWYHAGTERTVAGLADVLIASAPDLVRKLEELTGRPVVLVSNGVNASLFGGQIGPPPPDLPVGPGPTIGYHGSLYGDWFDWAALARIATAFEDARVVVIGDDRGHPPLPPNVHFLGLKPQTELLAYLGNFEVGLVPFVVSDVTHAVSPLKAYEYLAAGVPVAAPPLRALAGIENVHMADDLVASVRLALEAPRPDRQRAIEENSWGERLATLFTGAGLSLPPATGRPVQIKQRIPVHYHRRQRII